jgi:hypothetical protein
MIFGASCSPAYGKTLGGSQVASVFFKVDHLTRFRLLVSAPKGTKWEVAIAASTTR